MFGLGPVEIVILGAIAVMLYGKRLPEVGRSVGQTIGELRRQFSTLSREMAVATQVDTASSAVRRVGRRVDEAVTGPAVTAPRFDPPIEPAADESSAAGSQSPGGVG